MDDGCNEEKKINLSNIRILQQYFSTQSVATTQEHSKLPTDPVLKQYDNLSAQCRSVIHCDAIGTSNSVLKHTDMTNTN